MQITTEQLLTIIGEQQVEIRVLRATIAQLEKKEAEDGTGQRDEQG